MNTSRIGRRTEELRRTFDCYHLADVLVCLNQSCVAWPTGSIRPVSHLLRNLEPGNPAFYWAAAETVRHALMWCPAPPHERRVATVNRRIGSWPDLEPLVDLAWNAQLDAQGDTPEKLERFVTEPLNISGIRLLLPQWHLQRSSPYRAGHALALLRDAPRRRAVRHSGFDLAKFDRLVEKALQTNVEKFVSAVLQVSGAGYNRARLSMSNLAVPEDRRFDAAFCTDGLVVRPTAGLVLSALASSRDGHLQAMGVTSSEDPSIFGAPNSLRRRPLIQPFPDVLDYCVAPVPGLAYEWLYEPLMDHLWGAFGSGASSRRLLDDAFEEYVGLLADECSPAGHRWLHESELQPNAAPKQVDWVMPFADAVVLIECKRHAIDDAVRYQGDRDDWENTEQSWIKAGSQVDLFWAAVVDRRVGQLRDHAAKRPIGVIVTYGEVDVAAGFPGHLDAALTRATREVTLISMSVSALELLLSRWRDFGREWLPEALLAIHREGLDPFLRGLPPAPPAGPLWERFSRHLADVCGVEVYPSDGDNSAHHED